MRQYAILLGLGTAFGFVLSRGGATDYDVIQRMFLLQDFQLYGILGHTSETANQKDLAKTSFTSAAARWEKLAASNASDETIQQGLTWSKGRLAKLK